MRASGPMVSPYIFGLLLAALASLNACSRSQSADQTICVCVRQGGVSQDTVSAFQRVALQHGYEFHDNGPERKADLLKLESEQSIIPEDLPVNFHVEKGGAVVLMGTNFGSRGARLMVSFFYNDGENEGSPFHRAVMSLIEAIPNSQFLAYGPRPPERDPCAP